MASENIEKIRHSLAHILAQAVLEFYPKTKLGFGPAIENGFYYDFQFSKPLEEKDLEKIEGKMKELILQNQKFVGEKSTKLAAKKLFKDQPYKLELIKELAGKTVGYSTKWNIFRHLQRADTLPTLAKLIPTLLN